MEIVNKKITDLIEAEYNPRILKDEQFKHLKDSLTRFGVVDPVLVNINEERKNIIIGGHQRTKVWGLMGNDTIPCVELDLTLDKEKELNVRLNKNTGEFDFEMLANYFEQDDLVEWGFDSLDFGEDVIELEAEEDDFNEDGETTETDIVLGDVIEIGEHRLMCGDSTDSDAVSKLMDGDKADMVFTDPPYGVDYKGINNDDRGGLEELLIGAFSNLMINTKDGGSFYCFHSDKCGDIFHKVYRKFAHFSSMIIWKKESIVLSQTDHQSIHEPCLYGWFDNGTHKWYGDRKQQSVWEFKAIRTEGHTTPKPILLIEKALTNSSQQQMVVLDLFLGSGSTMVAAEQLKRKCYGMELDPKYCQVIVNRMIALDSGLVVKINGEVYDV